MAKNDDLTITVKDGKNLIKELITALNNNTAALEQSGKCACHEGKEQTEFEADPVTGGVAPTVVEPVTSVATEVQAQGATQPLENVPPVTAPSTVPIANAPVQQNNPQQVNFSQSPTGIPAEQTTMQNAPTTFTPPATPYYPANAVGPAGMAAPSVSNAPTTATTPDASAVVTNGASITVDVLATAGARLCEQNPAIMPQVIAALQKYNVQSVNVLPPQYYESFANDLRALGANI